MKRFWSDRDDHGGGGGGGRGVREEGSERKERVKQAKVRYTCKWDKKQAANGFNTTPTCAW